MSAEVKKAEQAKGGDLTRTALAVTPVGVSVSDSLRSVWKQQHISQAQVETSRCSSQCQAARCLLIWRVDAAAAAEGGKPWSGAADPEMVWNPKRREEEVVIHDDEVWGLLFIDNHKTVF